MSIPSDAYSALIAQLPKTEGEISGIARSLLAQRQFATGIQLLEGALEKYDSDPLRLLRAQFRNAMGDAENAIPDLIEMLKTNDQHVEIIMVLVDALIECAEYERARKMLSRAEHLNPPMVDWLLLDEKLTSLEGKTGRLGKEEIEKRSTMMGLPNATRSLNANSANSANSEKVLNNSNEEDPTIESGTFADLSAYLVESDANNDDTINTTVPEDFFNAGESQKLGDQQFDSMINAMGVDLPTRPFNVSEKTKPGEHALIIDTKKLSPTASGLFTSAPKFSDPKRKPVPTEEIIELKTEDLFIDDEELRIDNEDTASIEPNEKTELLVLTNDVSLDIDQDITTLGATISEHQLSLENDSIPPLSIVPSNDPLAFASNYSAVQIPISEVQNLADFDEIPTLHHAQNNSTFESPITIAPKPAPQLEAAAPLEQKENPKVGASAFDTSFPSSPKRKAPRQRALERKEPAFVSATEKKIPKKHTSSKKKTFRRWPLILGIMLLCITLGFLTIVGTAFYQHTHTLNSSFAKTQNILKPDDYAGYLTAKKQLASDVKSQSFLGNSADNMLVHVVPFNMFRADIAKEKHISLLAFIDALLEIRFEKFKSQDAKSSLENAKNTTNTTPRLVAATALQLYSEGNAFEGLAFLDKANEKFPNALELDESRVLIHHELGNYTQVFQAAKRLSTLNAPTIRQLYYIALSQITIHPSKARQIFSDILEKNPTHGDALINRSYLLRKTPALLKQAKTDLLSLSKKNSQYQDAKTSIAFGAILHAQNENIAAEKKYRAAVQKMPERHELYRPLLDFYFQRGQFSDAEALISKIQKIENNPNFYSYKAMLSILKSKYKNALSSLKRNSFNNSKKTWLEGYTFYHLTDYKKAIEKFDSSLKLNSNYHASFAIKQVARALMSPETLEDARHQLELADKKSPQNPYLLFGIGKLSLLASKRTSSETKREKLYENAESFLIRATKKKDPLFLTTLCDLYREKNKLKKAATICQRANQLAPSYTPGKISAAKLKLAQGKFSDALKILTQLDTIKTTPQIGILIVRAYIGQNRSDLAQVELNKWLTEKAIDPYQLLFLDGRIRFLNGEYSRAVGFLEQAYKINTNNPEVTIYYAQTLMRLGRIKKGLSLLRDAKRHPTWKGYAWMAEGEGFRKQRRPSDAILSLEKSITFFNTQNFVPTHVYSFLYTERALAFAQKFGWEEARVLESFRQAQRKGNPKSIFFHLNYGSFYLHQKKPKLLRASKSYERVLKIVPNHCKALSALSTIYKQLPRYKKKSRRYTQQKKKHCKK